MPNGSLIFGAVTQTERRSTIEDQRTSTFTVSVGVSSHACCNYVQNASLFVTGMLWPNLGLTDAPHDLIRLRPGEDAGWARAMMPLSTYQGCWLEKAVLGLVRVRLRVSPGYLLSSVEVITTSDFALHQRSLLVLRHRPSKP